MYAATGKAGTWLLVINGCYAAFLAALTVLNWTGADRFWPGALNCYLPQFIWAVPGLLLAYLQYKTGRHGLWLPLFCVAWVLGPIMGFSWPASRGPAPGQPVPLRVMTWNVKYGSYRLSPVMAEINRWHPDLVLFQDAIGSLEGPLGLYFAGWQLFSHGQFLIASRLPLSGLEVRELPRYGEGQEYLHCRLRVGRAEVSLYNVHFKTPRRSLNAFREARHEPWYLPVAVDTFGHNIETRLLQAQTVGAALKGERGPVLLAGDLNATESSRPVTTLREAGLRDAFSAAGWGYGFTYGHQLFKYRLPWFRASWMRIDHILASPHFVIRRCWTGTGSTSDHRPVIADLELRGE